MTNDHGSENNSTPAACGFAGGAKPQAAGVGHWSFSLRLALAFGRPAAWATPLAARRDLDEGPEILDRGDLALVDAADADLLGEGLHLGPRRLGLGAVHVRDEDGAVILDVELRPRLLLNGLDRLAARADQE